MEKLYPINREGCSLRCKHPINREGCSLRCKLYADDPAPKRIVVYGHGFGGHRDNKAGERFARHILEKNKGVGLVAFNWPCHGDDVHKTLRLDDCDRYLRLVLEDLRERFAPEEVYGHATSFGGYLFLKYISDHGNPFRRAAFRCPAVNMLQVLTGSIADPEVLARIEKGKPEQVGFDRKILVDKTLLDELRTADITGRDFLPYADELLILQGTADEVVPFDGVKAFAEENVIEFEAVEGADHRFQNPRHMDAAVARTAAFFDMR